MKCLEMIDAINLRNPFLMLIAALVCTGNILHCLIRKGRVELTSVSDMRCPICLDKPDLPRVPHHYSNSTHDYKIWYNCGKCGAMWYDRQ